MIKHFVILSAVLCYSYILNQWPSSFPRKENQNPDMFWSGMIITTLAALTTLKKSEKDQVLSRDQEGDKGCHQEGLDWGQADTQGQPRDRGGQANPKGNLATG